MQSVTSNLCKIEHVLLVSFRTSSGFSKNPGFQQIKSSSHAWLDQIKKEKIMFALNLREIWTIYLFSHLWYNEITKPTNTVNVVFMNISRWKRREWMINSFKRCFGSGSVVRIACLDCRLNFRYIQIPYNQFVIVSARYQLCAIMIKINWNNLVSMRVIAVETCNTHIGLNVP